MTLHSRTLALSTLFLCVFLAFASHANALTITPDSGDLNDTRWEYTYDTGLNPSDTAADLWAKDIIGSENNFLYKSEVDDGVELGALKDSYITTYYTTPDDPSAAKIEYMGGDIVGPEAFLLVKDGRNIPYFYLFNLTELGWNGVETLDLLNFWPDQGAISHVSLYGTQTPIPEPGTMLLLGLGLVGIAGMRKRFTKK